MSSDADAVLTESAGLGSALFRSALFIFISFVCMAAFITTTCLALNYLRNGRSIGAPYVYTSLSSKTSTITDAESAEGDHEVQTKRF